MVAKREWMLHSASVHSAPSRERGSPVINRDGEAVGLIFDGNIESLVGRFAHDESQARAVAVHPGYIMEALSQLYDAEALVRELEAEN